MAKRGPKPKVIEWDKFEFACRLIATLEETSGLLGVSEDTLEKRVKEKYGRPFCEVISELSGPSKISLRRTQFKMAETVPALAIWLGKQHLGQSDKFMANTKETKDDEEFRNQFFGFNRNGNGHKNGNGKVK